MSVLKQMLVHPKRWIKLTRATRVDLAKHNLLELVVQRQHTSTSNTTKDVGTSTLEQGLGTLLGHDLRAGVEHRLVMDSTARSHHHTTTKHTNTKQTR